MIKLRRFIDDPIGAFEAYQKEFEHKYQHMFQENIILKGLSQHYKVRIKLLNTE